VPRKHFEWATISEWVPPSMGSRVVRTVRAHGKLCEGVVFIHGPRAVRLVNDARATGQRTPASRARATRAEERASPSRATGAAKRARRVREDCGVGCVVPLGKPGGVADPPRRKPVQRLILQPGNREKREPPCREPRAIGVDRGLGKLSRRLVFERTGTPCSEVGFVVSGNWSGRKDFMVQAIVGRGRSRSFGKLE
jgi:hypothetical protein